MVSTTIHEITHVLGFSSGLYSSFLDETGTKRTEVTRAGTYRGIAGTMIVTPKLRETVSNHYNCPLSSVVGMELENEGGSGSKGSHFERTLIRNEAMTASEVPNAALSKFTLSLMEDSGWYCPNYENAAPIFFGAGLGCDFLN